MQTIAARWFTNGRIAPIRVIVIHSMEAAEKPTTAEAVANYFKTTGTKASAHVCVDNDSAVRCVPDGDTAWAAPGCNADGLQLELAGYARQTRADWLDEYSRGVLEQAARVTADWCRKWNIPARRLTQAELRAGKKGITCHADVSEVYRRSDHTDPGKGFPWDHFLALVKTHLGEAAVVTEDVPTVPEWPGRLLKVASPYMRGEDVRAWQRRMRAVGYTLGVDGIYGPESRAICRTFQGKHRLVVDGIVGPQTWLASWKASAK